MNLTAAIQAALIEGLDGKVRDLTGRALDEGIHAGRILEEGLLAGMEIIGARFRNREIFLPDVLLAARAMQAGVKLLQPRLEGGASASKGTVVVGTVQGDLHDIGKNLVAIMLRGAGFDVVDLGHDVAPGVFVSAARERRAAVVGMSALLTTTMPAMGRVVAALKEAGLGHVKTVVGGAAVSEEFARRIGADGYGCDAARAVEIVRSSLA